VEGEAIVDLSRLTLADKIIGATGLLLVIDLLFLPWHDIDLGPLGSVTRSAVESPNGFWGVLALLLTIAVIAVLVVTRLTETKLPELPVPLERAIFIGTIAVLALLLLKLVIETDALGFGAWLGILLAAGMVYGGFVKSQETPGQTAAGWSPPPPPPPA
jgi:hypothetical protein